MMIVLKKLALVAIAFLSLSADVFSATLNGEYSFSTTVTQQGSNSFTFDYYVTNINQSISTGLQPVGLDGFTVYIPDSAVISGTTNPPLYSNIWPGAAYWDNSIQTVNSRTAIVWWGFEWDSVYPVGETVHFSFTAENVSVGTVDADVTTFWNGNAVGYPAYLAANGAYYANYTTQLLGPIAISPNPVPEPSAVLLISVGLVGVGFLRRR